MIDGAADLPARSFDGTGARLAAIGRPAARIAAVAGAALLLANCASQQKVASRGRAIDPKYGVAASPRVIAEGQPVPKGGGRDLVGQPYVVAGRTYVPRENPRYARVGLASWYGEAFHGRLTANGEVFDRESIAAAHATMPLPSYARVTNLQNNRSMIVRVNDRGPYHENRIMDVSERVAEALEFRRVGTARVRVEYVGRASLAGSDDAKLMATLSTDRAAPMPGAAPIMVASAEAASKPVEARRPSRPAMKMVVASSEPDDDETEAKPVERLGPTQAPLRTRAALAEQEDEPVKGSGRPVPTRVALAAPALSTARAPGPAPAVPLPPDRPGSHGAAARPAHVAAAPAAPPPRVLAYAPGTAPQASRHQPVAGLASRKAVTLNAADEED